MPYALYGKLTETLGTACINTKTSGQETYSKIPVSQLHLRLSKMALNIPKGVLLYEG